MKIVLEEKDLVLLLGKALGVSLDPEEVTVKTDPFEVHVTNAEVALNFSTEAEPEAPSKLPEEEPVEDENPPLSMAALMSANDSMVQQGGDQPSIDRVPGRNEQTIPPAPTERGRESR